MAVDFDELGAPVTATANHNLRARQIKLVRQKSNQQFIGLTFDGRRGDSYLEMPAMKARDLGAPRLGLHMQDQRQQAAFRIEAIPGFEHAGSITACG